VNVTIILGQCPSFYVFPSTALQKWLFPLSHTKVPIDPVVDTLFHRHAAEREHLYMITETGPVSEMLSFENCKMMDSVQNNSHVD
jgi:hypothetical protein